MKPLNQFDRVLLWLGEFVANIRVTLGEGAGQAEW
jgi:hypothetical protein